MEFFCSRDGGGRVHHREPQAVHQWVEQRQVQWQQQQEPMQWKVWFEPFFIMRYRRYEGSDQRKSCVVDIVGRGWDQLKKVGKIFYTSCAAVSQFGWQIHWQRTRTREAVTPTNASICALSIIHLGHYRPEIEDHIFTEDSERMAPMWCKQQNLTWSWFFI